MRRGRALLVLLVVVLLAIVGLLTRSWWGAEVAWRRVPSASDPAVVAEARRVAPLVARADGSQGEVCTARVLRREGVTTWGWATCAWPVDAGTQGGSSLPFRVDGDRVRLPRDGDGYGASIRHDFPWDLAELVLRGDDRVRPEEPGPVPR